MHLYIKSYDLWNKIICKHRNYFESNIIDNIFKMLDFICLILNNDPHYICHGDFHPENILMNNHEIIICDWQRINIGKSISEIFFFISKALDFGINIIENEIIEYYCQKLSEYKMENVDKLKIQKEKNASILYITFIHWPYFLQNSNIERINIHYNNMDQAYNNLINNL